MYYVYIETVACIYLYIIRSPEKLIVKHWDLKGQIDYSLLSFLSCSTFPSSCLPIWPYFLPHSVFIFFKEAGQFPSEIIISVYKGSKEIEFSAVIPALSIYQLLQLNNILKYLRIVSTKHN